MSQNLSSSSAEELQADSKDKVIKTDIDSFSVEKNQALPVIDSNHSYYNKVGLTILFIIFILFGGWATLAPLSSASVAVGEVIVVSNNRVVEHYEGGIVSEILVREGDRVEQGQVLIKLSSTQAQAELSIIQSQLYEMLGMEARLQAESRLNQEIVFPQQLLSAEQTSVSVRDLINGQKTLFIARKEALEGELEIYRQRIAALREQINGLTSVVKTIDSRIASYEHEVKDWEALFEEQFADKIRLQEMKRELARLKGEKGSNQSEIARIKVLITENESQLILRKQQFREAVVSELRTVQSERVDLESRKLALVDRLTRVSIVSPVSGTVNGLTVFTVGEVVGSGEKLMEVVPKSKDYAVKAKVMVTDIDKVHPGLIADVRFSAFNTQMTHVIEGKVTHVSADKFQDVQTGLEYFEAKVLLTEAGIKQMEKDNIFLLPGMPAEVMIKTGERTLLGYFIKPFSNMFARSFNED